MYTYFDAALLIGDYFVILTIPLDLTHTVPSVCEELLLASKNQQNKNIKLAF